MIGRQPGPQGRSRRPERLQKLLRGPEPFRRQKPRRRRRQNPPQRPRGCHQHSPAVRSPETAAAVRQGRQLRRPAAQADPHRQQRPLDSVARRRPKDNRQDGIGRRPGDDQNPQIHIGVKDAVHHRHAASRQQPQAPPRRQLHRAGGQDAQPRQNPRRRVSTPRQGPQNIPAAAQGKTRQAGGREQQQIIHQRVQGKHAVYVNDRHTPSPFSQGTL